MLILENLYALNRTVKDQPKLSYTENIESQIIEFFFKQISFIFTTDPLPLNLTRNNLSLFRL